MPFARHLWDLVTLFDGLTPTALRTAARSPQGEPWREYIRWNGLPHTTKSTPQLLLQADHEYFDRALAHGIKRGWLIKRGAKIIAGTCPPEHEPMGTIGNEKTLRARLQGDDERKAFDLLLDPKSAARHTEITRKPDLRKSLKAVGQLYPILRWQVFGNEPIIIDGVTRYELLRDLGTPEEEISFRDLPQGLTAIEALQLRVEAEINSTAKDLQENARNDYIAKLEAEGFTQASIGKLVNLSRSRISEVLSTMSDGRHRGQTPTEEEVKEFQTLTDAGWNLRAVAEQTGWSKSTVSNYLSGQRTPPPPPSTNGEKPKRPRKAKTQVTPQVIEVAQKRGLAVSTIAKGSAPKAIAVLLGKPEALAKLISDPEVMEAILTEAVKVPEYVDFLRKRLK